MGSSPCVIVHIHPGPRAGYRRGLVCGTNQCQGSFPSLERWSSVNVKRIVGLLVLALLVFFVITQPDAAANALNNILLTLRDAASSITRFFTRVVS